MADDDDSPRKGIEPDAPAQDPVPTVAGIPLDRLLRPTVAELWLFLAIALPVLGALIATLPTVDLAYQLRAGDQILAGSGIPATDTWTFTAAGRPWLDQQWLAQVILASVHQQAGWVGLATFRAVLVGAIFGLVLIAIRARGRTLPARVTALLTLLAFLVAAPALALRPQLIAMVAFALVLALLARRDRAPRGVWLVPVIAAIWANLHGSFVLAPALVGLAWLADAEGRRPGTNRLLVLTVLTTAATLLNPFGPGVWTYATGLATNSEVTTRVSEWQPTSPLTGPGAIFWLSVLAVIAAVVVGWRRGTRPTAAGLLALAAFAGLGAITGRGLAWWPAVAVVELAGIAGFRGRAPRSSTSAAVPIPRSRSGSPANAVLAGGLVLAGIAILPSWRSLDPALDAPVGTLAYAPPGVTATLRSAAAPGDRVWNPQVWGSWLEFAVPEASYALDSRIELFPPSVWSDADTVAAAAPGWDSILDGDDVRLVIVEGDATAPLPRALAAAGWRELMSDSDGSVWARDPAVGRASSPRASRASPTGTALARWSDRGTEVGDG